MRTTTIALACGLATTASCGKSSTSQPDPHPGSAAATSLASAGSAASAGEIKHPIDKAPLPPLGADPGGATGKVVWATRYGGLGTEVPRGIALAASGDTYLTGYVDGVADFGIAGAGGKHDSGGSTDAYLMKLGADGAITWATGFGGKREDTGRGVAIAGDSIVVVGNFADTLTIGSTSRDSAGNDDYFIAAFDPTGASKWLVTGGGIDSDGLNTIAATPDGGFVVGGSFIGTSTIGGRELKSAGGSDAILMKISATGATEWVRQYGGVYSDTFLHLAVDARGNIFAQGSFRDVAAFGGAKLTAGGGADEDIVLAKYDANGDHLWSKNFGGDDDDVPGGIAVDPAGHVTMAGAWAHTIKFSDAESHTALGDADAFVARFDGDGVFEWAKVFGGERPDIGYAIAGDATGNTVTTGWFDGLAQFGKGAIRTAGSKDAFVMKLSVTGDVLWSTTFGDHDHDEGRVVAMDGAGHATVAGIFHFKLPIAPTPVESAHAPEDRIPKPDAFVVRFDR